MSKNQTNKIGESSIEIKLNNLENFGLIEGYDINEISKRKAKNTELFEEIKKVDSEIQEKVQKCLEKNNYIIYGITKNKKIKCLEKNNYIIYGIKKNKKIKGIYIFKEENNSLINTERIFTNEINDNIKNKYDKCLIEINKELVANGIYEKVIIGENVINIDPKEDKKISKLSIVISIIIGTLLAYIIFENIVTAIIFGLLLGPAFTGIEVIVTKKRGRKRKNK